MEAKKTTSLDITMNLLGEILDNHAAFERFKKLFPYFLEFGDYYGGKVWFFKQKEETIDEFLCHAPHVWKIYITSEGRRKDDKKYSYKQALVYHQINYCDGTLAVRETDSFFNFFL